MTKGRKAHRPLDWGTLTDEEKIKYLKKVKKPTASEKKELDYLLLGKKFAGMAEWLAKRRKKEKNSEQYKKAQLEKERKERGRESENEESYDLLVIYIYP